MTAPVTAPERYAPRSQSQPFFAAFEAGCRRFVRVVHRRYGKSTDGVALVVRQACRQAGTFFLIFPLFSQGRRVVWDSTTHDGRRMLLGYIPRALIASVSESEMQVVLKNGSVIQVMGADQPDRLRGTNPVGIVFDEYAQMDSAECWDLLRPVLAENHGWAMFSFTPRGRNHAWQLYEMARTNPEWFTQCLTVADTRRDAPGEDGSPIIIEAVIDADRLEGMPETLVQQEYYCSFAAAVSGAVYGPQLAQAEADGRIRDIGWDARTRVLTAWDIGRKVTAIIFAQVCYETVKLIDYVELMDDDLAAAVKVLREKPYTYLPQHIGPHDLTSEEWGAGKSRLATARGLGIHFRVLPRVSVDEGLHAARLLFPKCIFDVRRCAPLLAALAHYERVWDEQTKLYAVKPRADWAAHGADAFRYLGLGWRAEPDERERRPPAPSKTVSITSMPSLMGRRDAQ